MTPLCSASNVEVRGAHIATGSVNAPDNNSSNPLLNHRGEWGCGPGLAPGGWQ